MGILLSISCIFVADGAKNRLRLLDDTPRRAKAEDLLEVEPLVCRVRVMVLRLVWASRLGEALAKTEDLSKPEWCFVRWLQFGQNLEELAYGVRPGHADILILEREETAIPRPGLFLPRSAQVQLGWCLRADFPRSAHIALVVQKKAS